MLLYPSGSTYSYPRWSSGRCHIKNPGRPAEKTKTKKKQQQINRLAEKTATDIQYKPTSRKNGNRYKQYKPTSGKTATVQTVQTDQRKKRQQINRPAEKKTATDIQYKPTSRKNGNRYKQYKPTSGKTATVQTVQTDQRKKRQQINRPAEKKTATDIQYTNRLAEETATPIHNTNRPAEKTATDMQYKPTSGKKTATVQTDQRKKTATDIQYKPTSGKNGNRYTIQTD